MNHADSSISLASVDHRALGCLGRHDLDPRLRHRRLIGTVPFPSVLHLLYTGNCPTQPTARLIDAVMVASIDHGAGAPSVLAARTAISGGATLQAAAAAGLLTLRRVPWRCRGRGDGDHRRGRRAHRRRRRRRTGSAADELVAAQRAAGRRIPGFGHRQHKVRDPRLDRLFAIAREVGVAGDHLAAAPAIEASLDRALGSAAADQHRRWYRRRPRRGRLPEPSRQRRCSSLRASPAMLAHANEERQTMTPMRRIDPIDHAYADRPLAPCQRLCDLEAPDVMEVPP